MTLARLRRLAAVAVAALGLTVAMAGPASAAPSQVRVSAPVVFQFGVPAKAFSAPTVQTGKVYCTRTFHSRHCLDRPTWNIRYLGCGTESHGGDFDLWAYNPNSVNAPREISVFFDGDEVFGDSGWAEPGLSKLPYRGLPNHDVKIVIGWPDQGLVFASTQVKVTCGSLSQS